MNKTQSKTKGTSLSAPVVLGMGNALVDIIFRINGDEDLEKLKLPKGSMNLVDTCRAAEVLAYFAGKSCTLATGGAASNAIVGLAALGIPVGFIGSVGKNDEYGGFYRNDLNKSGVQVYLKECGEPSGTAITLMSPDSERTFATFLGAALSLDAAFLKPEYFEGCHIFHVEGFLVQNYELIETAMQMAKAAGAKVSCDLASYNVVEEHKAFLDRIVPQYVDILFVNEEEAVAFSGHKDMEAANYIGDSCEYVVVKLGQRGSLVKHDGRLYVIAPRPATRADTNGAGDAYAAGFLYGLAQGLDLQKTGEIASLVSSKVVEVTGPKLPSDTWALIREEIKQIRAL